MARSVNTAAIPGNLHIVFIITHIACVGMAHIGRHKFVAVDCLGAKVKFNGEVENKEVVEDSVLPASVG